MSGKQPLSRLKKEKKTFFSYLKDVNCIVLLVCMREIVALKKTSERKSIFYQVTKRSVKHISIAKCNDNNLIVTFKNVNHNFEKGY